MYTKVFALSVLSQQAIFEVWVYLFKKKNNNLVVEGQTDKGSAVSL